MQEFKVGCATVRIHGTVDEEKLKASTENFVKKVERNRKNGKKKKKTEIA